VQLGTEMNSLDSEVESSELKGEGQEKTKCRHKSFVQNAPCHWLFAIKPSSLNFIFHLINSIIYFCIVAVLRDIIPVTFYMLILYTGWSRKRWSHWSDSGSVRSCWFHCVRNLAWPNQVLQVSVSQLPYISVCRVSK